MSKRAREEIIRPSITRRAEPPGLCVDEDFHEWDTNETHSPILISQVIEITKVQSEGRLPLTRPREGANDGAN